MKRIAIGAVCVSLALPVFGVACSDLNDKGPSVTSGSPSTTGGGSSVTVGALLPLSGDLASYGASQAALDEAVAALQAEGNRVALSVRDTATDPAKALEG